MPERAPFPPLKRAPGIISPTFPGEHTYSTEMKILAAIFVFITFGHYVVSEVVETKSPKEEISGPLRKEKGFVSSANKLFQLLSCLDEKEKNLISKSILFTFQ